VLQAMILTDKDRMLLTPTYHVFRMYVPFQDATYIPLAIDAGTWTQGAISLPRVDAIAAKEPGPTVLALTNVDPTRLQIDVDGARIRWLQAKPSPRPGRQHQHSRTRPFHRRCGQVRRDP
jgi:alpha-L-arabinofuranosidase